MNNTSACRKSLWVRIVTGLLVLLIIEINPVPRARAATAEPKQPTTQPHSIIWCAATVTVLVVGGIVFYHLYKFCKTKLGPPPPPPPPVPPHPPTNAPPPVTNHLILRPMDIPPFPTNEPPCTNCPPDTNTYPLVASYWIPSAWTSLTPQSITNTEPPNGGEWQDISGVGYMDSNGIPATPWFGFVSETISNVQSSTDTIHWSNYTYHAWLSSNGVETVIYDGSGFPVITNYDGGNPTQGGATNANHIPIGIWINNGQEPNKFFRIMATP